MDSLERDYRSDFAPAVRTGAKLHHGSGGVLSSAGGVKMLRR